MQPTLLTETRGAVRIIRFIRPEQLNGIDVTLAAELTAALRDAEADPSVRCVLLEADGKPFMAGGNVTDFKEKMALSKFERRIVFEAELHVLHRALYLMRRIAKPVLCAVNGAAAGAGFSLATASDFVIATDDAFFVLSHVSIGASPDAGATYFLPRAVGSRAALEFAILGERLRAEDARRLGLITRICDRRSLREESMKLAERLARYGAYGCRRSRLSSTEPRGVSAIQLRSLAQHNVSLAGGTRSRAPPSLHAGVAITVPRSGAFLTGLATALGPGSRRYASALC
jgi:2-(1,2-epoxy-1,2-dihydrophenyl)acetyl-CoA isomerase